MPDSKPVIIIGAGDHAKVLLDILLEQNVNVIGLTDKSISKGTCIYGVPVIGDDSEILKYKTDEIELINGIGSVGNTSLRTKVFVSLKEKGYVFKSVIHPYCLASGSGDSVLKIGNYVSIAQGVKFLLAAEHKTNSITTFPFRVKRFGAKYEAYSKGDIVIDDDVWIGENALIFSGVHIGQGAVIGAGSYVTKDVPPYAVVVGTPAKIMRYRFDEDKIEKLLKLDLVKLYDSFTAEDADDIYADLTDELIEKFQKRLESV